MACAPGGTTFPKASIQAMNLHANHDLVVPPALHPACIPQPSNFAPSKPEPGWCDTAGGPARRRPDLYLKPSSGRSASNGSTNLMTLDHCFTQAAYFRGNFQPYPRYPDRLLVKAPFISPASLYLYIIPSISVSVYNSWLCPHDISNTTSPLMGVF